MLEGHWYSHHAGGRLHGLLHGRAHPAYNTARGNSARQSRTRHGLFAWPWRTWNLQRRRARYSRPHETKPSNWSGSIATPMRQRPVRPNRMHTRVWPERTARRGVGASSRRIRICNGPILNCGSDIRWGVPRQGAGVAACKATAVQAMPIYHLLETRRLPRVALI